jgi:hypothetical protein
MDGNGEENLYLPDWPASNLVSVYEDDVLLASGTDYVLYADRGILRRLLGKWSTLEPQNIKVTVDLGVAQADVPRAIQALVLNKVAKEWVKQKGAMWGQTSRNVGDGSLSFELDLALTDEEKSILDPYRRILA